MCLRGIQNIVLLFAVRRLSTRLTPANRYLTKEPVRACLDGSDLGLVAFEHRTRNACRRDDVQRAATGRRNRWASIISSS